MCPKPAGFGHIKIFGGGGGVIVAEEVEALHEHGIERIYTPEDGRKLGLVGMISDLVERSDFSLLNTTCGVQERKVGSFNQI